jgi:hypothetical protein
MTTLTSASSSAGSLPEGYGKDQYGNPIDWGANANKITDAWNKTLADTQLKQTDILNQYGYKGNDIITAYGDGQGHTGTGDLNLAFDPTNRHSDSFNLLQNYGTAEQNASKNALFRGLGNTGLGNQQIDQTHQQQSMASDALHKQLIDQLTGIGGTVTGGNIQLGKDLLQNLQDKATVEGRLGSTLVSQGGTLADPTAWQNLLAKGTDYVGQSNLDRLDSGKWDSPAQAMSGFGKIRDFIKNLAQNTDATGYDKAGLLGLIQKYNMSVAKSGLTSKTLDLGLDQDFMRGLGDPTTIKGDANFARWQRQHPVAEPTTLTPKPPNHVRHPKGR